ncbi:hypothetical protein OH76DRAFT_1554828 [Lentinus brumalis]|uniref:F-box domain-containing protein n=1 Tax=Lentinus brumalis TaxID=2498619 RepID=A0A371DH21_9APHY|nr:hypothetical protein OH76DRAFT_1554828 [Polyporus brumalis]
MSARTALNGVPPIHALPVELIVSIIHHYAQSDFSVFYAYHDGPPREPPIMNWVALMLVCRRWRNIALNTPRLWRLIHVTADLDLLRLHLARSAPATIDVFFMPPASLVNDAMPILLTEAHRIRTISHCKDIRLAMTKASMRHFLHVGFRMLEYMKPLFSRPLPALETMVIWPTVSAVDRQSAPFDLDLMAERHPQLRKLACSHIRLPSSPTFWSSLRELHLGIRRNVQYPTLVDDILHILASTPQLEILQLPDRYSADPAPHRTTTCALETVVLQHLRIIEFCGRQDSSFVGAILQHILVPVLRRLHLEISVPHDAEVGDLVRQVLLPAARGLISTLDRLHVAANHWWVSMHSEDSDDSPLCRFRLKIHIQSDVTLNRFATAFDVLCHALQDAPLEFLHFRDSCHSRSSVIPQQMWQSFLSTCTSLRTVKFENTNLPCVYSMLDALATPGDSDGALPSCPDKIQIVRPYGVLNSVYSHDLIKHLLDIARARASANRPLQVCLEMAHLQQQYLSRFRDPRIVTVSSFKAHRWLLLALAEQCNFDGRFWDSHHKTRLDDLFDENEWERIDDEMSARRGIATGGLR